MWFLVLIPFLIIDQGYAPRMVGLYKDATECQKEAGRLNKDIDQDMVKQYGAAYKCLAIMEDA
jgi:hypothetical protein